jgi:uncharacterized protein (TIGR00251 family)
MHNFCRITDNEIHIAVKALPGASKTEFAVLVNSASNDTGEGQEPRLRVRVAAAPENGKANTELITFFARALGCPKRDIQLLHGEKSRLKTIAIPLAYKAQLEAILREEISTN